MNYITIEFSEPELKHLKEIAEAAYNMQDIDDDDLAIYGSVLSKVIEAQDKLN